MFFFCILR